MPLENWEEEGLAKIPNLDIAQWRFLLTTENHKGSVKVKDDLLGAIKAESELSPFYRSPKSQDNFWSKIIMNHHT